MWVCQTYGSVSSCAYQPETCPLGLQRSDHELHDPIFAIGERHGLVMHRIVETDPWRPEMHPADDRGRLDFGRGREDDGSPATL